MMENLPLVERLFTGWQESLGEDYDRYRNHVYRVINLALAHEPDMGDEAFMLLQVAAAYHDVGIWLDGTLDYLEPSADRACGFLARHIELGESSLAYKQRLVTAMILQHHALRRRETRESALVEAFRKADWTDLTLGVYRFGLPRRTVREIQQAFPLEGFHWRLAQLAVARWRRHPFSPLPMLRW